MNKKELAIIQALRETAEDVLGFVQSLWWLWLIVILTLVLMAVVYWFFANHGIGNLYRQIGEGQLQ